MKAEYGNDHIRATAFAADTPYRHRREEIRGNGLSGPYALGAQDVLPNSERVVIPGCAIGFARTKLSRAEHLCAIWIMTLTMSAARSVSASPFSTSSSQLDPQFIVIDYEVDELANAS